MVSTPEDSGQSHVDEKTSNQSDTNLKPNASHQDETVTFADETGGVHEEYKVPETTQANTKFPWHLF